MSNFNRVVTGFNAIRGLAETNKQIQEVKNSNLSPQEKELALKSHKKMMITTLIVVISLCLFMNLYS